MSRRKRSNPTARYWLQGKYVRQVEDKFVNSLVRAGGGNYVFRLRASVAQW